MNPKERERVVATKTIVRWKPPNELYDRRELTLRDLEGVGIFTQKQGPLAWDRKTGYWVDAEEVGIAKEVMDRLESPEFSNETLGWFTIETQEIEDKPSPDPLPAATGRKVRDNPQA